MSGSNALPPIAVKIDGAQAAQQAIDGLTAAADRMGAASARTAGQVGTLRTQAEQAGGAFRNTGQIVGQAGYQIQDFAVQVASGQSALTAFIQQGSQLAGIFGPGGAIAGAVLAIGGIAAQFLLMGESAEEAKRRAEASFKGMAEAGKDVANVLREINALFLTASQRAANAANAQVGNLRDDTRRLLDIAIQRNEGNAAEMTVANRDLAQIEAGIARRRAETFARTGSRVSDADRGDESRLFAARARVAGLDQDMARQNARIGELNAAMARLANAGVITQGGEEFGPPAPERPRQRSASSLAAEAQRRQLGPLDGSPQSLIALERGRIQSLEAESRDAARVEQQRTRALEREEEANRRTTDRIVDYGASAFADLFAENSRGFEGMLETFEKTAISTFARIAAEAIIRPIVEPVVSGLGLGGLGGGNGGLSGLFGGSGGSGIGGYINNPIWQPGAGFFASNAAGTQAGLEALGPGVNGPALPGGGTMLGSLGQSSLGQYAAGIGGGYMAGSAVGGYLAGGSKHRQQNAQIGAAGGAVAGAIIGSVVPVIGTVIGGVIGGVVGGVGGGMLGPGAGFKGGDVGVAVDANGFLTLGTAAGKQWNGAGARDQTTAQLDQINQMLRVSGLTIGGGSGQIGRQGYGASTNVFGPSEIWAATRGNLTTSNSTLRGALGQSWMQSFEDLSVIAPYAAQNDNMNRALDSGAIRSRDDFARAGEFITGIYEPMVKASKITNQWQEALSEQNATYDDAINRARELGLAEADLTAARDKAQAETTRRRDTAVHGALESLRIDELRGSGNTRDAAITEYNLTTGTRVQSMRDFLTENGIIEGMDLFGTTLARLTDVIEAGRQSMLDDLAAQDRAKNTSLHAAFTGVEIERLRGSGNTRDAAIMEFNLTSGTRYAQYGDFLTGNGIGVGTDLYNSSMSNLSAVIEMQRKAMLDGLRQQEGGSGRALMQELTLGGLGGLSGGGQYTAGLKILADAKASGNLDTYTSAARSVLTQARGYLGTSERYGALVADISQTVRGMGGDPVGLASMLTGQNATNDNLERIYGISNSQLSELKGLRAEVSALNATIAALIRRQAA